MKLSAPGAQIIQMDLTMYTDGILRGWVMAYWVQGTESADYVVWRAEYAPHANDEIICEGGRYFHLSPGFTCDQRLLAHSQAQADFNDKRGVQIPPF